MGSNYVTAKHYATPLYGRRLTNREREIVGALAEGERCNEIAVRLGISVKTVENTVRGARIKLGARTAAALTYQFAIRYHSAP